ncbi:NAD(P)/FAD-dependent oxidoreductase [Micavibrio aeruginosavorus]|uniref:NAD(P)/FAD-dependent oxidoreductase n=1 Tax=Micavibrio aeruginosavorus TaxID=349221 RepID=UPI003F4A92F3
MLMRKPTDYIDTYYRDTMQGARAYDPLVDTVQADVCVIGGGLAGLNTALGLVERGRGAVVIEAARIGWGASGRNGGFVAKGYACDLAKLKKKVGLDHARALVNLTKDARAMIKTRINDLNIPCGPLRPGVLTVSWKDNPDAVRAIVDDMNNSYDLGFEFWGTDKVRSQCHTDKYFDGVYSPGDFQFHPLTYVQGLANNIVERGGKIYEGSKATKITQMPSGRWRIEVGSGGVVEAEHVVLCCSIYVNGLDKRLRNAAFPVRTFVMVTEPVDPADLKTSIDTEHAIYDMRFASDYYRVLPDNRIMWGGRVSVGRDPAKIAELLHGDMLKVYPQLRGRVKAEYGWSGDLCYAPHKMPQIGQLAPNYWYATCFGGHGLAPTTVGGEMIAGAIADKDDRYKLFSPFGLNFAGGPLAPYIAQSVYWWWRARDYIGG